MINKDFREIDALIRSLQYSSFLLRLLFLID